jgi:hypothetical protein
MNLSLYFIIWSLFYNKSNCFDGFITNFTSYLDCVDTNNTCYESNLKDTKNYKYRCINSIANCGMECLDNIEKFNTCVKDCSRNLTDISNNWICFDNCNLRKKNKNAQDFVDCIMKLCRNGVSDYLIVILIVFILLIIGWLAYLFYRYWVSKNNKNKVVYKKFYLF